MKSLGTLFDMAVVSFHVLVEIIEINLVARPYRPPKSETPFAFIELDSFAPESDHRYVVVDETSLEERRVAICFRVEFNDRKALARHFQGLEKLFKRFCIASNNLGCLTVNPCSMYVHEVAIDSSPLGQQWQMTSPNKHSTALPSQACIHLKLQCLRPSTRQMMGSKSTEGI